MKKLTLAAVLALTSTSAFAGGISAPVMEETVVVEEAAAKGSCCKNAAVPLILLAIVGAIAAK